MNSLSMQFSSRVPGAASSIHWPQCRSIYFIEEMEKADESTQAITVLQLGDFLLVYSEPLSETHRWKPIQEAHHVKMIYTALPNIGDPLRVIKIFTKTQDIQKRFIVIQIFSFFWRANKYINENTVEKANFALKISNQRELVFLMVYSDKVVWGFFCISNLCNILNAHGLTLTEVEKAGVSILYYG